MVAMLCPMLSNILIFRLNLVWPGDSVFTSPAEVNVTERGGVHTLTCHAESGPGNTVRWVKQGETAFLSETPELTVSISGASDGGVYVCVVENLAGSS